jgi:hypothetical protein
MKPRRLSILAVVALAVIAADLSSGQRVGADEKGSTGNPSKPAEEAAPTTILSQPPPIHCPGCAKIAAERVVMMLRAVPGVGDVEADVAARTVTVRPRAGQTPSPQALWDAVVRAGYRPFRVEGPGGTLTAPAGGASWYHPPPRRAPAERP